MNDTISVHSEKRVDFATTHWQTILAAGQSHSAQAEAALEQLYRTYWYPLYAFVRRNGFQPHDAQDLTQEFFARLLAHRDLKSVRREKGRFRSFLLVSLKHFLVNEWQRSRTEKRGAGRALIPLDEMTAEKLYGLEPADDRSPDKIFERRWALTVLDRVLSRVRQEYAAAGKERVFDCLKGFFSEDQEKQSYAEVAADVGLTEAAAKQAVHRLRRRYRELLRAEIAHTVATPGDIEDELQHLISALRS
ncbi:MAG: sigma-70 family RNA polymerase sigma factor [Verrucomicrobiales bacterium]|nr:sigma-70 family RNA polymerase sigma factor [Verrucomicrobiales bacterium]